MWYSWLADLILCMHISFVLFVVFGGLLVLRWRWIMWLHLPAAVWGTTVELVGWSCPLTPLENWLREEAGETGYSSDFSRLLLVTDSLSRWTDSRHSVHPWYIRTCNQYFGVYLAVASIALAATSAITSRIRGLASATNRNELCGLVPTGLPI